MKKIIMLSLILLSSFLLLSENSYVARILTSFDKIVSEGWVPMFELLLENGVAFRKR